MTGHSDTRPRVAVTMGDPSGIGPEIVVGALGDGSLADQVDVMVIGDLGRLRTAAKLMHVDVPIELESERTPPAGGIRVRAITNLPDDLSFGAVSAVAGAASFAYLREAIHMAMAGDVEAIVTAPIHKEAWRAAGVEYADHTSALADLTKSERHAMMLANDELRTVLVTTHVSLVDALAAITQERVQGIIELADEELRAQGIKDPRIAVAGVNPHAGEGGMFGDEESEAIAPAVEKARSAGINATGPLPPDTVFMRARRGEFDVVIAQYHDQGLIPVKLLGIEDGVNVTLGLPFVRTSVDHGTAFDIAGTGQATAASLRYALKSAIAIVLSKRPA